MVVKKKKKKLIVFLLRLMGRKKEVIENFVKFIKFNQSVVVVVVAEC